jgi:signal transduction histidine kinase/CheY-like chemotaxis protein
MQMGQNQRLASYLAKLFLAAVVPLLALAGVLIYQVVGSERETRLQSMQDLARTLSSAVDAEVNRSLLALQMLAASDNIDRLGLDEIRARFEQAKALHGRWSSMTLLRADGTRLLNLRVSAGWQSLGGRARGTGLDEAIRAGRVFISDVMVSSTSGKPTVFFGVPVIRNGAPIYGITASMEFDVWTGWLKERIPAGAIAAIDDRSGVIFARSERPEPFVGKPATDTMRKAYGNAPSGIVRNTNREGVDIYGAYATSAVTGWHTLIILPAAAIDAGPRQYALGFAAMTVAVLLVTLIAATVLARPLSVGIEHLRDSIHRVGAGAIPGRVTSQIAELDDAEQAACQAASQLGTARDDLVRQRGELRTMLDLLPVGVAIAHDADARQITVSPVFEEMFGLRRGQDAPPGGPGHAGVPYRCLRAGRELAPEELPLQRAARSGTEVRDEEFDVELRDGTRLHMLVNAAPLFDASGSVRGAIAAHIDVTTLKRAQESLQEADRQKNEFLATLAHELRNPLAPIRYASALLKPDTSPAMIDRAKGIIERQSAHMARLLDDLLDISRIARNVIELKRELVDLQPIVAAAVDNARPAADEQGHTLLLQPATRALWLQGDPVRLLQIMDNLLSNAYRYTPAGGRIVVATAAADDWCEVRVTDNGIELAPEMVPRLFSLFGQVHPAAVGSRGGMGIGLAVVRRLVDLHSGTIDVHSDGLGAGSTFVVRLPLAPASGAATPAMPRSAASAAAAVCRVLVVDDNVDGAETLAAALRLSGFEVRTAHTVQSALALVSGWCPRVAVLDIGLPDGSGNELARRLREQPWGHGLGLVAITGWGQDEDRARTSAAGFDAHLVKPVDPEQVRALVDRLAGPAKVGAAQATGLTTMPSIDRHMSSTDG